MLDCKESSFVLVSHRREENVAPLYARWINREDKAFFRCSLYCALRTRNIFSLIEHNLHRFYGYIPGGRVQYFDEDAVMKIFLGYGKGYIGSMGREGTRKNETSKEYEALHHRGALPVSAGEINLAVVIVISKSSSTVSECSLDGSAATPVRCGVLIDCFTGVQCSSGRG